MLIRRGAPDCTLYFVLNGTLEVVIHSGDGVSMGPLTRVGAGSVLGEQSFFDGHPRSASVWAVVDSEVAAMSPQRYAAFAAGKAGACPRTPVCARPDSCDPPAANDGESDGLGPDSRRFGPASDLLRHDDPQRPGPRAIVQGRMHELDFAVERHGQPTRLGTNF